jgi:3'(2'), 5'-bisphosphate nucleotidase
MLKDNYAQVGQILRAAGQKALTLRAEGFQVAEKGVNDYVTNVDQELDQWLTQQIKQLFPDHKIISEENSRSFQGWGTRQGSYWLIDPIDGTEDFIQNLGTYAVMAGLLENGCAKLGFIYAPERDLLYWGGALAGGFYVNDVPQPLAPVELTDCQVILSKKDQRNYGAAIMQAVPHAKFYSLGSFGLKVLEVVMGKANAYIYLNRRVKLWDTVAPLAIAKARNFVCTDLRGQEISFSPQAVQPETLTHHQEVFVASRQFNDRYREKIYHALQKCGYYD